MSLVELKAKLQDGEALIIISEANRRYLTDFSSSDGYLIVTKEKTVFLTDSRYIEEAEKSAENCDEILLLKKASEQLPELAEKLGVSALYTEAENLSVSDFKRLRKMFDIPVEAEKTDDILKAMRREKRAYEKDRIVDAQRIAERAFLNVLSFIKPGVTENEIRLNLEFFMLSNGAQALSFDTIAISGKNTSKPHGVPTDKKVENGDFITMDYGAVVDGYHSDMTRTVAVGQVSGEQAKIYDIVLNAQLNAINACKPGVKCSDMDKAARDTISQAGYGQYFGHGTGHGVGIDIHEAPSVSPLSAEILQPGDVVTAEPGIYIPEKFGVRIEDMLYVTADGNENLTNAEKKLIIL